ncbi:hypothetical protein LB533_20575 [Mesorhizobium sp. BR1-1-13]|uniref:hypothetical protein n=1 Tax=Mesorhizobium sp. BR1-1-13 TaxID=2876656 RepID=UPI001CD18B25|nr:hypothetical protein [Mesorhizobium sp. BR1-1-13]MBZ9943485.1 hypothetical protein [Mesorhizobium sp. BR1-1-13]
MTSTTYSGDPRRSFMVNGAAYQRQLNRKEPDITLVQSAIAGLCIALFAVAVLFVAVAVS